MTPPFDSPSPNPTERLSEVQELVVDIVHWYLAAFPIPGQPDMHVSEIRRYALREGISYDRVNRALTEAVRKGALGKAGRGWYTPPVAIHELGEEG